MDLRQKKLIKKLILYLIILQILLLVQGVCAETGIYLPDQYAKTNDLSESNFSTVSAIDKDNLTENEKKLSTSLLLDAQDSGDSGTVRLLAMSYVSVETSPDEPVYVYVYMLPGYSTHIIDYIANVTGRDEANNFAVAWVDTGDLYELASIEGVRAVREVIAPGLSVGSVTTEGDIVHKTANVRSEYGYTGKGVKIGIISNGVNHINDSQASGDLPDDVHVLSDKVGGDEGTAMLEIVHDMVPDAELYFHDCGNDEIEFNHAIDALVSSGCKVICDDVYWAGEPYFEDGVISSHLESLLSDNDIVYVAAATNLAEVHYQGEFYESEGGLFHDFSSGTNPNRTSMYVGLTAGSGVRIILQWNDKFGSSGNDYDLYLSDISNSSSKIEYGDLDYSVNTQDGSGDPLEYIEYYNPGSSDIIGEIDVRKNSSAESRILELFILPKNGPTVFINNVVAADSIFEHAAVPDVITTAAVDWSTPSTIESYSSRGPVTISYPTPEIRAKPDITGVDGVSITGAGGFSNPFYGTSAAAPHVAAVAAQIWGAHHEMTAEEVRTALYNSAVDLGETGKDTTFGYGRADALAMADSLRTVVSSGLNVATRTGGGPNTDTGVGFATDLKTGGTASFTMNKGAVYIVSVTAGTDVGQVMISVQKDGSLPSSIEEPDTGVYEYEDVTVYYADESDLSGGTFEFKVEKSWLSSHGYGSGDIVLLHYNEETDEWEELETTLTGEDGTYCYYSAETSSFSWFAIAVSEGSTIVPEETPTAAITQAVTASATPSPSPAATVNSTATPDIPVSPGGASSWTSMAIPAIFVVLVIIVIAGLAGRRRKEEYPDWWDHGRR